MLSDYQAAAAETSRRLRRRWTGLDLRARLILGGIAGGLLIGLLAYAAGGKGAMPDFATAEVPVVTGTIDKRPIPVFLDGIGTVQASKTVQIRPRVDGEILEIRFEEGQDVAAGDILAVIDPRTYEANFHQAEANLLRDQAQLKDARSNLRRLESIGEFASRKAVDNQRAQVAQFEALVAASTAQVAHAKAQLDDATVRSPIAGRTGLRQMDVGNLVRAGDPTPLVTVTQLDPVSVLFTLNADNLPLIVDGMAAGPLPVEAYGKDNRSLLATGSLDLVDNQIDQATGTVKLKASFPNPDHRLWPGQFVNARLRVAIYQGLSVAATAIQQGPNGAYLWTIDGDGKAGMRSVVVTRLQDGTALITSSLPPGQKVVIDGQYKLQPGVATVPAPAQPEAPIAGSSRPDA
ncbi:efflux RND transporter periplasmic adaptor subunit [Zavarzinia compransoris]|uniref:efflux RND transporter periplasmic adaptor subunit n=1 Tax=Zavarzinia marina TaxID=2911065 RepID=UPI001F39C064|nr:efflux RND transporter periplasmic adaptor subunit [Zavarzinia marina]MCF4166145.1 efflux RND transporter periplasmic adaptor subunit [Zavarzinia marina]